MSETGSECELIEEAKLSRGPMTRHRRSSIVDIVQERGAARVDELAEMFQVSEVTIRNDLVLLERDGLLARDRGGAVTTSQLTTLLGFSQRATLNRDEKRRIGKAAAAMVSPGDTIILDAGTTVVEMVRFLDTITPLTVVTNAFNVVAELNALPEIEIIFLGGVVNRTASSTLGGLAEQALSGLVVQKAFLGTQALDAKFGLTDTTMEIAEVKRAMIAASRQTILLTDSSKWGHAGLVKVAPLSSMQTVITDSAIAPDARTAIEQTCDEVVVV
ncbi:MAG: DeoR/GlpR family DNA-binding transcription regulator [Capsulimonadaceae bacterium]|nr:DeoR/GlpR family DNA-binding transcription regulator [Capsulimonadaceae bacterium]